MAKLQELNGWELMGALADIAEPIGNLVNDDALWECFVDCTRKGVSVKEKTGLRFILQTYAKLIPLLLGQEHKRDTVQLLSAIEGKPVAEIMQMNGKELLEHFRSAISESLIPFFTKSVPSEKTESSLL